MDPVGSSRVLDMPVEQLLEAVLREAGAVEVARVGLAEARGGPRERLLATDDLWVTPWLARAFVKAARKAARPAILALPEGLYTEFTEALQDLGRGSGEGVGGHLRYPLVWLPAGSSWSSAEDLVRAEGLEPVVIEQGVSPLKIPMHKAILASEELALPLTHLSAMRINHWMHIVRANQIALLSWGASLVKVHPLRVLWAAVRAMSLNKWRVMGKLGSRGRGCDIHPSAVVEASTLGDGVRVGANAVVRFSHLGDGVSISDQCNIQYSVLGQGASVARMGMLQGCVMYPGSNSGHYGLQLCVVGRGTFVGGEVVLGDFKPQGEVMVSHRGALVSSGTNMIGCAVGHDCQILMRATAYPGREVPNGYWILGSPHDILAKIPTSLPLGEPLISDEGVLRPYAEVMSERKGRG